jgi:sedoheptulose-bisphosphatase
MPSNTNKLAADPELQKVYDAILGACEQITEHIRYNTPNKIDLANEFGDVQLDMDV